MDPLNEPVTPRPGLARAVGLMNVIFGGLLLLAGGWAASAVVPTLRANTPLRIDPVDAQQIADGLKEQQIEMLTAQERAATTEDAKSRIRDEKAAVRTRATRITEQVDFATVNRDLSWVSTYLWADLTSGPVLNLLLVVSGFGLLGLKGWGRSLALGVAVLKLVRLVVLSVGCGAVVVPSVGWVLAALGRSDIGDSLLRTVLAQANGILGTSVALTTAEIVQLMTWLGYGYAILLLGLGAIYPAVVLLVLTRPAARASCLERR